MRLRELTGSDEAEALAAQAELAEEDFPFLLFHDPSRPWAEHVAENARLRAGVDLPADRMRAAFLLADVDGQVVGRSSIRFELNDWLAEIGGHVGYAVRPQFRRRGYATQMLQQSLELLRADGVPRALVTCDDANAASATVIERCGGVFERMVSAEHDGGVAKRRYWIDL